MLDKILNYNYEFLIQELLFKQEGLKLLSYEPFYLDVDL